MVVITTFGAVSASHDNITADELSADENLNLESTADEEIIAEDSDNSLMEKNINENDLCADEGEFIDVNDAYIYLNQFRNEARVWQWNEDNTTKTVFNTDDANQLQPLERNSDLEQTAKIRAKELAQLFSHTRPDGTDCFTAFPDNLLACGENIAMGQTSCYQVTEDWKETNDLYSGQGHRRNMLSSNFNAVGIAGYKLNGVIYWVQDFGKLPDNSKTNTQITVTVKNTVTPKITAKKATFKAKKKTKKYSITLKAGKTAVKKVKVYLKIGKKTFQATTGNNGKATFNIKLNKKGNYKSTVTFKGNKNYSKATKKVNIILK